MSGSDEVLFEARGALGLITLNRPRALNALTLDMIHAMSARLGAWAGDADIRSVLIRGAGEKAFCAGGDIRALYQEGAAGKAYAERFFRDEYRLNRMIFRYPKPYVALIDGIAMGGGVGVSVNGRHRVVCEASLFAMPETGIGMFPDVGGSYFLPRCPGETGLYLGLTGKRLRAADCIHAGIAGANVPQAAHAALIERLAGGAAAGEAIAALHVDPGAASLAPHRAAVDRCFAAESVEGIIAALEEDGGAWAQATRAELMTKSPFALKVAFRQLRRGRALDFEGCMKMEYRISQRIVRTHDFREGVRAVIIDKDQSPRWEPAGLADVDDAAVEACFAPLDGRELSFEGTPA